MKEKARILFLDDESVNLENIGLYLTKNGYSTKVAEDGVTAIQRID